MSNMGSSGSRLPLVVGGGCAGLLLLGLALVGLGVCALGVAALGRGQGPQPKPVPQPTQALRPTPGPQPKPGPSPQPSPGGGFTLVQTGGYTCDVNAKQCRPLISGTGSAIQVQALGDGSIQVQFPFGGLRVNRDCSLVDQPGYTLFPCPFFPNVQGFQGLMVTPQGAQPIDAPFQYALIDIDFDQDGIVNEPGYYSHSSGSLAFEAYREDGTLKFAGYIVDTGNYTYLYVFTYQAR
jgi:hypothetical protein